MQSFLDSSVLVATFCGDHKHHARSIALFSRQKKSACSTAAHCLADVYAVVTGMPGRNRASPDEALLFLRDVRERLPVAALSAAEHIRALEESTVAGIAGGSIYDALIAHCALKARAQTLYTWHTKHFVRLAKQIASGEP